jgi:hypothetical protein
MPVTQWQRIRPELTMSLYSPQMQMLQQAKQNPMQRDPSGMDANRDRPSSPASGENAPSPSKRQRIDAAQFNPNQPGAMMPNGRPVPAMQGQQMAANTAAAAHQMLTANGINPSSLNAQQFQNFVNMPPAAQQKSIATYSQNLQQHHGSQMGNKTIPNAGAPQNQGSPMMPSQQDGSAIAAFYNAADMGGPGGLRPGPGAAQPGQGGSNHALQDYQMQLMLLEQQNKKRLMMARQEQDNMGGVPREGGGPGGPGGPGAPQGPNGQPFPDASPQAMRTGTSPNPTEQMKRGTPQMNNSGIPSPVPEGGQSRGSPNPAMNFMGNHVDPSMAPHFFKGMEGNMAQAQMNGLRAPSSHPGQPFNGQMNPQQLMAARQAQQQGQPGQQPQPGQPQQPGVQGNPQQWQPGPNGQMMPQGMQQNPQVQGTPQQRAMPPPSAPAAAGPNANSRTTASPQQTAAAPPTPNQSNKAGPKKKDTKNAKDKVCLLGVGLVVIGTDLVLSACGSKEVQSKPQRRRYTVGRKWRLGSTSTSYSHYTGQPRKLRQSWTERPYSAKRPVSGWRGWCRSSWPRGCSSERPPSSPDYAPRPRRSKPKWRHEHRQFPWNGELPTNGHGVDCKLLTSTRWTSLGLWIL